MTTITISTDDARSVRALAVLATAHRWTHATRKSDGREFWIIPSSDGGRVYYADARNCTCPDSGRRLLVCKHSRAVELFTMQRGALSANLAGKGAPAPACRVCTQALPAGLLAGVCDACEEAGLTFEAVAAIGAAFGSDAGAVITMIGGTR